MNSVTVKVRFNDDTRRFQINQCDSWEVLKQRLITTFGIVSIRVKYTDEESDEISLDSQEELDTAIEFAKSSGGVLRLRVEDLAKSPESIPSVPSFQDYNTNRLMSKKIWKNEKKLKKERKRYYAALAEEIGESRKETSQNVVESPSSNEQEIPTWFSTAMEKFSKDAIQKILEQLEGTALPNVKPEGPNAPLQYLHYDIECDGCGETVFGVRYKCGNCADYDLCERCEPLGIHNEDHVFIKLKRPTHFISVDPLLPRLLYSRPTTLHRVEKDGIKEEILEVPLINDEVVKISLESSNPELDSITDDAESSISSLKGHRKCLDAKFVSDVNLPDNSFVFLGVPFTKSWVVKNAGSKQWRDIKLVHKEGHAPVTHQVVLPDLQPGEETQVTVNYMPIGVDVPENKLITSSWRFVHKDKTVFGDELWLSVFGLNNNKDGSNSEPFDIVESPTVSLISITTAGASADEDTLNSRVCPDDQDNDASSVASDDSFVVVIPDCFDPGVPLLSHSSATKMVVPPPNDKQEPTTPVVQQQQQQQANVSEPNVNLMTFDEPVALPTQPAYPLQSNSEPHPQENITTDKQISSPQRPPAPTPYQMLTNPRTHILGRNPWQVGAAFIDSTMHQLDKHIGQPSGMYGCKPSAPKDEKTEASKKDDVTAIPGNDTDDEEFQDCTFDMLESAEPKPKPPRTVHFDNKDTVISAAGSTQSSQLYPELPAYHTPTLLAPADNSHDVTRLLNASSAPYQPPPPWTPREPESPMQQLINLGFGNRQQNARLLHKHGNNIQAVVNELLDTQ